MINGKYHAERKHNGKPIIVDLCQLPGGKYEAMTLQADGTELASYQSASMESAVKAYRQMLRDYPETGAPLTGKYAKLRDDLREALKAGRSAFEANPEDGGTCNFDSAAVALPRWMESKVKQAAEEAGTRCFTWTLFGSKQFVFVPMVPAQGNARSRAAEAMTKALKSMGYDAMDYCQMD